MKSTLKTRALKELSDAYLATELRVNPDYQRGLQWGTSQKQGLIDSLLRGYQIPIFYIHIETRTNNFTRNTEATAWIVDGQQRLASIVSYLKNEFPLPDPRKAKPGTFIPVESSKLPPWVGKKFQELDLTDKDRLINHELLVVEINAEKNEVRDLFIRLQNGTPLTAQEKRDAWPGDFTNFIIQHAGKPGHRLSNPKPFFTQFKKTSAKRLTVADGEHYVDGHAEMRKFFAGLAMTVALRERSGIDFVDLKGKTINDFYIENLDFPQDDPGAIRVINLLDLIANLPKFSSLKEGAPMSFQMAFHFALLVDSLDQGNYVPIWKNCIVNLFSEFKRAVSDARLQYRQSDELIPHHEKFGRLLSGSGSDTAEVIRARHAFLLSELYPKLNLVIRDETRCFDVLEREVIWNRDKGRCQNPKCVRPDRRVSFNDTNIHHIIEHSSGGVTSLKNGILICIECHTNRQAMKDLTNVFQDYISKIYSSSHSDAPLIEDNDTDPTDSQRGRNGARIKITINWGVMDIDRPTETIVKQNDTETIIELIRLLIIVFKDSIVNQLTQTPIIRHPLSANPDVAFLNRSSNQPYSYNRIPGTNFYLCPQSDQSEKIKRLKTLFLKLTLPNGDEFPEDSVIISLDNATKSVEIEY